MQCDVNTIMNTSLCANSNENVCLEMSTSTNEMLFSFNVLHTLSHLSQTARFGNNETNQQCFCCCFCWFFVLAFAILSRCNPSAKNQFMNTQKKSTQSMKSKHIIEMEEDNACNGSSFNSTIVSRKHNISKI